VLAVVEVPAGAPLDAGAAVDWAPKPILRSNEGVPDPQPSLEPPAAEPAAADAPDGDPLADEPDACLVELLRSTLSTPSIRRRRDMSFATSG
jgi:hypothetical protein